MVTNKAAFHVEQPAPARSWGLTPLTAQITCTFGTPTGHKVTAIIVESHDSSHISVHVTNDTALSKQASHISLVITTSKNAKTI